MSSLKQTSFSNSARRNDIFEDMVTPQDSVLGQSSSSVSCKEVQEMNVTMEMEIESTTDKKELESSQISSNISRINDNTSLAISEESSDSPVGLPPKRYKLESSDRCEKDSSISDLDESESASPDQLQKTREDEEVIFLNHSEDENEKSKCSKTKHEFDPGINKLVPEIGSGDGNGSVAHLNTDSSNNHEKCVEVNDKEKNELTKFSNRNMNCSENENNENKTVLMPDNSDEDDVVQVGDNDNETADDVDDIDEDVQISVFSSPVIKAHSSKENDGDDVDDNNEEDVQISVSTSPAMEIEKESSPWWSAKDDLDLTCPFCGVPETSLYRLEFHIETIHAETPFSDKDIQVENSLTSFSSSTRWSFDLSSAIRNPHDITRTSFTLEGDALESVCPLCDLDLGDEATLEVHMNTVHGEEEETASPQQDESPGALSCPLCAESRSTEEAMKEHINTHGNDNTFYGISAATHDDDPTTPSPTQTPFPDIPSSDLTCPMCGLGMWDADLLTSHVESHFNPQHSPGPSTQSSFTDSDSRTDSNKENVPLMGSSVDTNWKSWTQEQEPSSSRMGSNSKSSQSRENLATQLTSKEHLWQWKNEKRSSDPSSKKDNVSYQRQYEQNLERAVMKGEITVADYHEQKALMAQKDLKNIDDGQTRVSGLIESLQTLYRTQARPGQSALLCSPCDHFSGSYGDKGWGCGYRNLQMLLSSLIANERYARRLFPGGSPVIPSIPKIQQMIEAAWQKGFDPQGCVQLGGRLSNTRKWIGATEIVAVLSSLGVKCRLADFHVPTASDGTHPRLLEWVEDYYSRGGKHIPPLYLQHQGHSRTIVGVEKEKGTIKLLLFDPGSSADHMTSLAQGPLGWKHMRTFRRTQAGFKARQYQIVAVVGLLSDAEYQDSKILRSERVS